MKENGREKVIDKSEYTNGFNIHYLFQINLKYVTNT